MASFSQQMSKALKLIDGKKVNTAARGALKKNRKNFAYDLAAFMKKETGLLRSIQTIVNRLKFKANPKTYQAGVSDDIFIRHTQFSFLAFPHKIKQKRRKSGSLSSATVLESVNIGKGFKKYEGVFIGRGAENNKLPFRRTSPTAGRNSIKSMQVNSYNMITNNSDKFNQWSSDYSIQVMTEMGRRMIRVMARQANKKVKFNVGKG